MPLGRREHDDPLRCVTARGFPQCFGGLSLDAPVDQDGVPCPFRQQRPRHLWIGDLAGLTAPALQPPGDQRGLDALRGHQHDRLTAQIRSRERAWLGAGGGERNRNLKRRADAWLTLQRDTSAHAFDDAL